MWLCGFSHWWSHFLETWWWKFHYCHCCHRRFHCCRKFYRSCQLFDSEATYGTHWNLCPRTHLLVTWSQYHLRHQSLYHFIGTASLHWANSQPFWTWEHLYCSYPHGGWFWPQPRIAAPFSNFTHTCREDKVPRNDRLPHVCVTIFLILLWL